MKPWILCASLLGCLMASGQQPSSGVAFEVASIKPSAPPTTGRVFIGMNADGGMLRYTNVSLKECIRVAYRVKDFQVQGPDWIGDTRFDIVAKLPAGPSKDQIPEMLQALLADRFKLLVHRDSKVHSIYALVVGKGGAKLKPAEVSPGDAAAAGGKVDGSGMPRGKMMMQIDPAGAHLKAPSATLAGLAEMISHFTERPVVDMTGIEGQYDFDLVFSPETMRGMPGGKGGQMPPPPPAGGQPSDPPAEPAGTIFESVRRYGLKLEPRKAPMDVLIVDRIEKAPTEN